MPKVHTVKAAKDYPDHGIKKGDTYYKWSFMNRGGRGTVMKSKTYPKPSQLTRSEFMSAAYEIEETIGKLNADDGLPGEIENIISDLRDLADQQDEKFENMPEGLQQGDTGQLLEQRRDSCNEYADELENIDFGEFKQDGEKQDEEGNPLNDEDQTEEEYWQEKLDEVANCSFNIE